MVIVTIMVNYLVNCLVVLDQSTDTCVCIIIKNIDLLYLSYLYSTYMHEQREDDDDDDDDNTCVHIENREAEDAESLDYASKTRANTREAGKKPPTHSLTQIHIYGQKVRRKNG
jgi:hypothetical protein